MNLLRAALALVFAASASAQTTVTINNQTKRLQATTPFIVFPAAAIRMEASTIASLKAITVSAGMDGQQVEIAGYAVAGDGGGGTFQYSASSSAADNGGTIFAPTAGTGRWLRIYSGEVNVLWFGATNGGAADTTAFLAAIAASKNVFVPEGTFTITSNLLINTQGASLRGLGRKSILSYTGAGADGVVRVDGALSPAYISYIDISDIAIVGTGTVGIRCLDVAKVTMRRVYLNGFTTGLKLDGALICSFYNLGIESCVTGIGMATSVSLGLPCNLNQFTDCQLVGNTTRAVVAVQGATLSFSGCQFEANGTAAQPQAVLDFSDMGTVGVNPAVTFSNCWFETNSGAADIKYRGNNVASGLVLNGCAFYSTAVGYNIDANTGLITLTGNGFNAAVTTANVLFGAATTGYCLSNLIGSATLTAGSGVITQDSAGKLRGLQRFSNTYSSEWFFDNTVKATIGVDTGTTDLIFDGNDATVAFRFQKPVVINALLTVDGNGAEHSLTGGDGGAGTNIIYFNKFGGTTIGRFTGPGMLILNQGIRVDGNLSEYADNAAAISAGKVAGDFYRTVDVLKVVH